MCCGLSVPSGNFDIEGRAGTQKGYGRGKRKPSAGGLHSHGDYDSVCRAGFCRAVLRYQGACRAGMASAGKGAFNRLYRGGNASCQPSLFLLLLQLCEENQSGNALEGKPLKTAGTYHKEGLGVCLQEFYASYAGAGSFWRFYAFESGLHVCALPYGKRRRDENRRNYRRHDDSADCGRHCGVSPV